MGLVTHCVPDAELDAFVEQYMEKLRQRAAAGYAPHKTRSRTG